jgi:hypothetical protein
MGFNKPIRECGLGIFDFLGFAEDQRELFSGDHVSVELERPVLEDSNFRIGSFLTIAPMSASDVNPVLANDRQASPY